MIYPSSAAIAWSRVMTRAGILGMMSWRMAACVIGLSGSMVLSEITNLG